MTALGSEATLYHERPRKTFRLQVAADVKIWKGARCVLLGQYLQPLDETEGLTHPCKALETVDNTGGAAGALYCDVEFADEKTLVRYKNDTVAPVTAANIGGSCYGVDDSGVVSADGTLRSRIGTPWLIVGSGDAIGQREGVYVEQDGALSPASLATLAASAPGMQAVNATLALGTITISTGITVAADSEVVPLQIGAITGSTNFGSLRELKTSRVAGAPGVGTVVIQAVGNDGALDADAAGAIRVLIFTPQS
jgi:hypothetical protein